MNQNYYNGNEGMEPNMKQGVSYTVGALLGVAGLGLGLLGGYLIWGYFSDSAKAARELKKKKQQEEKK